MVSILRIVLLVLMNRIHYSYMIVTKDILVEVHISLYLNLIHFSCSEMTTVRVE